SEQKDHLYANRNRLLDGGKRKAFCLLHEAILQNTISHLVLPMKNLLHLKLLAALGIEHKPPTLDNLTFAYGSLCTQMRGMAVLELSLLLGNRDNDSDGRGGQCLQGRARPGPFLR